MPALLAAFVLLASPQTDDSLCGLGEELAELGLELDTRELTVEVRAREACRADIDRQQDLLFAPTHFDATRVLFASLGLDGGLSAAELRAVTVEVLVDSLRAYYQWDRRALVLVQGSEDDSAGEERDRAWLHELAHAWQDRELSVAELFDAEPRSMERMRIAQTLLEGHAEAVAMGALLGRRGLSLSSFSPDEAEEQLGQLLAGAASTLPYRHGQCWFATAHARGGWPAVHRALDELPASTEQLLHPAKFPDDTPCAVAGPDALIEGWPGAERLHVDTVGEMTILALFMESGLEAERATLAAAGWDGDLLHVWRGPSTETAAALCEGLTWRTLWDREEDAQQFAAALAGLFRGRAQRVGRVVDAVWAQEEQVAEVLASALAEVEQKKLPAESDAESTAEFEQCWLSQRSKQEAEHWVLPRHRLRIPIPEGWALRDVRGVPALKRTPSFASGFAARGPDFDDNIAVAASPHPRELSIEQLQRLHERGFEAVE